MLSGKHFRITRPTVGIHLVDGEGAIISIPTDGVIEILSGPNEHGKRHEKGLVYALWEGQTVALFAVDIEARGVEIRAEDGQEVSKAART